MMSVCWTRREEGIIQPLAISKQEEYPWHRCVDVQHVAKKWPPMLGNARIVGIALQVKKWLSMPTRDA